MTANRGKQKDQKERQRRTAKNAQSPKKWKLRTRRL
jgi:hypothetical protein